jgi:hypothetical protein
MGEKVYKALDIKTETVSSPPTTVTTKGFWFCELLPVK